MIHRSKPSVLSFLSLLAFAATLAAQDPFAKPHTLPADRAKGGAAVDVATCKQWLYTLASPEFEGRQTGQPGFQKAADFVTAHFQKLGLEARGANGTYLQQVPWTTTQVDPKKTWLTFSSGGKEVLRVPADRLAGAASGDVQASGDVVLLVVEAPVMPESDPKADRRNFQVPKVPGLDELDVAGKVVVVYQKPPAAGQANPVAVRFAVQQALAGKSPAALLFAQDEAVTGGVTGRSGASRRAGNPAVSGARRSPADLRFGGDDLAAMLRAGGTSADVLKGTALTPTIALQASVSVSVGETQGPAWNVFAVLPGSDPKRKDEYVVVGSHLDHVGMRGGLHPGADDDGSGTTGVLAVSTMFVQNDVRPARSILFVCFCGEEDGLIGSDYFAKNCPVPLSSIVGELQMDMIGRDEEENREGNRGEKAEDNRTSLHLVGTQKLAPALHQLCLQKNESAGFSIEYDQEGMFGRSDHANFAKFGVPIAFFFTGLHRDYHETTDTPDKIHYEKLLRVASYVYDIAFDLATMPGRPEIDPELWQKYGRKASEKPAAPLLGAEKAPAGK